MEHTSCTFRFLQHSLPQGCFSGRRCSLFTLFAGICAILFHCSVWGKDKVFWHTVQHALQSARRAWSLSLVASFTRCLNVYVFNTAKNMRYVHNTCVRWRCRPSFKWKIAKVEALGGKPRRQALMGRLMHSSEFMRITEQRRWCCYNLAEWTGRTFLPKFDGLSSRRVHTVLAAVENCVSIWDCGVLAQVSNMSQIMESSAFQKGMLPKLSLSLR